MFQSVEPSKSHIAIWDDTSEYSFDGAHAPVEDETGRLGRRAHAAEREHSLKRGCPEFLRLRFNGWISAGLCSSLLQVLD